MAKKVQLHIHLALFPSKIYPLNVIGDDEAFQRGTILEGWESIWRHNKTKDWDGILIIEHTSQRNRCQYKPHCQHGWRQQQQMDGLIEKLGVAKDGLVSACGNALLSYTEPRSGLSSAANRPFK